jgi:alpha-beta hydrolase superfamily lysophospholipase
MLSISPMLETPSWREWGYDKVCRTKIWSSSTTLPAFVINQSLESFFGKQTHASNHARIQEFTESMKAGPKPLNYLALERMWVNRENLLTALKAKPPITVPTITVYGGNSFRSDHVVAVAGSDGVFKSKRSEMIEVWRGGDMVHEEDAGTVLTIFVTMLQGFSIIV